MDWRARFDTTFSDIWRGRNLRRLLLLWLAGLITLTVYGTTTNTLPVPDLSEELTPSAGPMPRQWSNDKNSANHLCGDFTGGLTMASHACSETIVQMAQVWTAHVDRMTSISSLAFRKIRDVALTPVFDGSVVNGGLDEEAGWRGAVDALELAVLRLVAPRDEGVGGQRYVAVEVQPQRRAQDAGAVGRTTQHQ